MEPDFEGIFSRSSVFAFQRLVEEPAERAVPDHARALVTADYWGGTDRLDRAESAAQRALTLLETIKAPRRIGIEEGTTAIAQLRARSHGRRDRKRGARRAPGQASH